MKTLVVVLPLLVSILGVMSQSAEKHYGLVVTAGDNPDRNGVSNQISSMGVCVAPDVNIPNLPTNIAGAKSVWIEKNIMFCGGSDSFVGHSGTYPDGWGAEDKCWKVKPGDAAWEEGASMNEKRGWFSLTNIKNKRAVAAGGMSSHDTFGALLDTMEKYSNGQWKILKRTKGKKKGKEIKLKKPVFGHCAVHYKIGRNDFLMTIGGSYDETDFSDAATNDVTVYNLDYGSIIPQNPGELQPVWAPACTINGRQVYVSGGGYAGSAYTEVYRGTIQGNFKKIGDLQKPRWGHEMGMPSAGRLFVIGGYDPNGSAHGLYIDEVESSVDGVDAVGKNWNIMTTTLTEGGEYAAIATVPAFTFTCQGQA